MIRVGLIGASAPLHRSFLAPLYRRRAGIGIVGLSEPDDALRRDFSERYELPTWPDHRKMLDEARPSLVAVCEPNAGQVVIDALRAGVDVLVAPPVCATLDELEVISDLAEASGRRVTAAHTYRGHPAARTARELVDAGRLGKPDLMSLIIGANFSDDQVRTAVVDTLDLFGWLTGVVTGPMMSASDTSEDRPFGQLIMNFAGTCADGYSAAVLEVRRRDELVEGAGIIQVAGDAGAIEWDTRTGLLRSALGGGDPITVDCGPFVQADEWVLNNLLRRAHPVITTQHSLAVTRMWLSTKIPS